MAGRSYRAALDVGGVTLFTSWTGFGQEVGVSKVREFFDQVAVSASGSKVLALEQKTPLGSKTLWRMNDAVRTAYREAGGV